MDNYILEFELQGLPRMTNASGKSKHWRAMNAEAQKWKKAVFYAIATRRPAKPLKRAKITLTRFSSVSPDPDGLVSGFKHVVDGLVIARIIENDRVSNIGMPDYRWVKSPAKAGKIRVRVEEFREPSLDLPGEHL